MNNIMNELISVIVPAMNAELYIKSCLDSVYSQDYPTIEVIVVYDTKSNDNTLRELNSYKISHPSLIIDIGYDENLGSARNRGLDLASGDYIVHIDADDLLMPNYLSILYDMLQNSPDASIACCNYLPVTNGNILSCINIANKSSDNRYIYSKGEAFQHMLSISDVGRKLPNALWVWMVRKSFLIEQKIRHPNYSYGEDAGYTWRIIGQSNIICVTDKVLYLYRVNENSMTQNLPLNYCDLLSKSVNDVAEYLYRIYPDILPTYYNFWNIEYLFILLKHDYSEYISGVNKYIGVRKLNPRGYSESLFTRLFVTIFNISQSIAYVAYQLYLTASKCVSLER